MTSIINIIYACVCAENTQVLCMCIQRIQNKL